METTGSFASRTCKKRLLDELERLEKERSSSLRLLQASRNLFQKRYHKFTLPLSRRGSEAASIQMFETHSPGFCYRRNGDCRSSDRLEQKETTSLTDAQAMLQMLLTDGEVDIEKVVCLHLLAAHLPPGVLSGGQLQRATRGWLRSGGAGGGGGQQPSSKTGGAAPRTARGLPAYVITLVGHLSSACSSTQCKLSSRSKEDLEDVKATVPLVLNDQVERLVESTVDVLQKVNTGKVDAMMELIKNPTSLRLMLSKKKIRTFLDLLQGAAILSSEDAFVPTTAKLYHKPRSPRLSDRPKGVTVLTVTDANLSLQRLINQLRSKIFGDADVFEDQSLGFGLPGSLSKISIRSSTGVFTMPRKRFSFMGFMTPENQFEKASTYGSSTFSLNTISTEEDEVRPPGNPTTNPSTEQGPQGETLYPVPNKIVRKTTAAGFSMSGSPLVYPVVRETSKPKDYVSDAANIARRRKQDQRNPWPSEAAGAFKWNMDAGKEPERLPQAMGFGNANQMTVDSTMKPDDRTSSLSLLPQPAALSREAVAGFRLEIASSEARRRLQRFLRKSDAQA